MLKSFKISIIGIRLIIFKTFLGIFSKNLSKLILYSSLYFYFSYLQTNINYLNYILFIFLFSSLTTFNSVFFETNILSNKVNYILLKPYSIYFSRSISENIKNIILFAICVFELLLLSKFNTQINSFLNSILININITSTILIINGIIIGFNLYLISCFLYFWIKDRKALGMFKLIIGFLSGFYFPLFLIPNIWLKILFYTPFLHIIYIPYQSFFQKNLYDWKYVLINSFFWVILTFIFQKIIWKSGINYYNNEKNN